VLEQINILLAEDNLLNQKIANFILRKVHAGVCNVVNGKQAIDKLSTGNFDVILMDLQMPEMDGYTATRYIRNDMQSTIPIIALSASMSEDEMNESKAAGMNAFITKPFDAENLYETIVKLVNAHRTIIIENK
jgi:CheY-like chemotaxis protein